MVAMHPTRSLHYDFFIQNHHSVGVHSLMLLLLLLLCSAVTPLPDYCLVCNLDSLLTCWLCSLIFCNSEVCYLVVKEAFAPKQFNWSRPTPTGISLDNISQVYKDCLDISHLI